MKKFLLALLTAGFSWSLYAVDFNRDIRPILSNKCFACHGFDEHDRKADLRLDTKEGAFADLGGYAAIVPGDPDKSEAWLRIDLDEDEDDVMPPQKFHKPLTATEKSLIKTWIKEGAEYKTHWSYAPLETQPVPNTQNVVDHFVGKKLAEKGLQHSAKADKITLARRLHFDLLGLPPKPEVIDAYVKDSSPQAYEKLVDQLLANPAFGERLAVYWLDLVRYADTIGYHSDNMMEVSAYRDYVVDAFNKNIGYDQFVREQLAGDLLPEPTQEQKIASGYNRLLQSTEEGGAQAAEYMVIHAADRVRNASAAFLGSTIGCAQCHDHKYDPFTARDFYSFAAFFADVKEKPIGRRQPNLRLPTEAEAARLAELNQKLKNLELASVIDRDAELKKKLNAAEQVWKEEIQAQLAGESSGDWTPSKPVAIKSNGGQTLTLQEDDSVLASGKAVPQDNYTIGISGEGTITAFRLETLTHPSLTKKSLSRGNGNFVLTQVIVKQEGKPLKIATAKASFEQTGWPVAGTLDGKNNSGWAVNGHQEVGDHEAVFIFETPVNLAQAGGIEIELHHQSAHQNHNIGRFRISLTTSPSPMIQGKIDLPNDVLITFRKPEAERIEKEHADLQKYFHSITPLLSEARERLEKTKKEHETLNKGIKTMLVSEPLNEPRMTRILNRGDWLDKEGEVVQPALPAFLPKDKDTPADRKLTRLDLANWIMADSNPLTSRTMVNRVWMLLFGEGISRNVEDLGGQGDPPSHPELLDQLSINFRESGWDLKALVKDIVLSATYQQVSTVSEDLLEKDPINELLGRQGRWRIDAEFVRDTSLSLSGLLVDTQGGRSVKPYQPSGYWQHLNFPKRKWQQGQKDELYRRGLYTFWCRSFPHPAMVSFDAPSREECTAKRSRSNIPQQALVLLNDPVFVEAARKFGDRIAGGGGDVRSRIQSAWQIATNRPPTDEEAGILTTLYQEQQKKYASDEEAAKEYLSIGDATRDESISLADAAAWTQVARAILNTYEVTSRN